MCNQFIVIETKKTAQRLNIIYCRQLLHIPSAFEDTNFIHLSSTMMIFVIQQVSET